jgi:hypothetical protein
MRPVNI